LSDDLDTPESAVLRIRAEVARQGRVNRKALLLVETALVRFPHSVALWCLRGDLIQLSEDDDLYSLESAAESYLTASTLNPTNPEPFESLGHFYDTVMDDPARAEPFFRKALSLGAGQSASQGLASVLEQLGSNTNE
jgi:hypothetical protein